MRCSILICFWLSCSVLFFGGGFCVQCLEESLINSLMALLSMENETLKECTQLPVLNQNGTKEASKALLIRME